MADPLDGSEQHETERSAGDCAGGAHASGVHFARPELLRRAAPSRGIAGVEGKGRGEAAPVDGDVPPPCFVA